VEDVTLGNVLFHKGQQKTSLFTGYTVQLCIFGRMKGGQVVDFSSSSVRNGGSLQESFYFNEQRGYKCLNRRSDA
jgi:hypothetical protein